MKNLIELSHRKSLLMLSIIVLVMMGCQKFDWHSIINGHEDPKTKKIYVSGIAQLYSAVNDPANTGVLIVLAPGTYLLDPSKPNAGRLELLENMGLQGQQGHPEKVIIDASSLPGASFLTPLSFPAARTGAIRAGRGLNTIEWLSVKGNSSNEALSVIDADLIWAGSPSRVRIAHSIVTGGRTGIGIRNVGPASIGRILEAEIADNELTGNLVQYGQAITIQNANGATRATIRVSMHGNNVHGNILGLRVFNNKANNLNNDSGKIYIQSTADRFDDNNVGMFFSGGLNQGPTGTANENYLYFEANGTSIQNNRGIPPPDPVLVAPCGIYAAGAFSSVGGIATNNRLEMIFSGCTISGNQGDADIVAIGAYSPLPAFAGTDNVASIKLYGVSKKATVLATQSSPIEPAGTNKAIIVK